MNEFLEFLGNVGLMLLALAGTWFVFFLVMSKFNLKEVKQGFKDLGMVSLILFVIPGAIVISFALIQKLGIVGVLIVVAVVGVFVS